MLIFGTFKEISEELSIVFYILRCEICLKNEQTAKHLKEHGMLGEKRCEKPEKQYFIAGTQKLCSPMIETVTIWEFSGP